jgi:hypothetical protein
MKRIFEVRFYWEKWISDEETEKIGGQTHFECQVSDEIPFNSQGVFGIVRDAFTEDEKENHQKCATVTGVRELADFELKFAK